MTADPRLLSEEDEARLAKLCTYLTKLSKHKALDAVVTSDDVPALLAVLADRAARVEQQRADEEMMREALPRGFAHYPDCSIYRDSGENDCCDCGAHTLLARLRARLGDGGAR